jgi:hypothetical protein
MKTPTLQQVIQQHINLPTRPNGRGFYSILCKVCNDHGKKGKRAGFKFENKTVGYNCFNCGHGAGYDPDKHETMPRDMITVLEAFGIPEIDWQVVLFDALASREAGTTGDKTVEFVSLEPDELTMPPFFYRLTDDPNDDFAQYGIQYLTSRNIDWKSQPFYLVRKIDHPDNERWYGRLIIPVYKGKTLIFWQGRDLTDLHVKKYLSPNVPKENVLFGYDQLDRYTTEPLYILEGWFDAYHLDGIAVFGSKMTPNQVKIINRSPRPKVVVPDRAGDGQLLALQALELGWSISTPQIEPCKDVDAAISKYGKLYTQMSIVQHTHQADLEDDHFNARAALGVYCEVGSSNRKKVDKKPHKKPWQ